MLVTSFILNWASVSSEMHSHLVGLSTGCVQIYILLFISLDHYKNKHQLYPPYSQEVFVGDTNSTLEQSYPGQMYINMILVF